MNIFTTAVWEVINEAIVDDETLLAGLKQLLLKEYAPFLSTQQSVQVHTHALQAYVLDKLNQRCQWLPNTTIHVLGSELALEAFQEVDWSSVAGKVRKQLGAACAETRESCSIQSKN